jgi:Spy/CpxP family protein refolding chaperone
MDMVYLKNTRLLLLATAVGVACAAYAQPAPNPAPDRPVPPNVPGRPELPDRPFPPMLRGEGAGAGIEGRLMSILTEEQRRSLREAMQDQREKIRDLEEKLRGTRREILEASLKPEFDEPGLREKAMAAAQAEAELTVLRPNPIPQVKPPLTPGQIERLKEPMFPGPGRFGNQRPFARPQGPRDENGLPPRPQAPAPSPQQ